MDGRRFDSLATSAARRHSRRTALRSTGAGLAAVLGSAVGARRAVAQEATPDATPAAAGEGPAFLFVQTATGGGFSPNPQVGTPVADGTPTPGGGAAYLLTLEGHHGATIYFSDRPDRIFGDAPTQQFLDGLGFSPANPPNAALVTQADADEEDEVIILELLNPTYDEAAGTLTYGATILGEYAGEPLTRVAAEQEAAQLPEAFGRASLFIDDCPNLTTCIFIPIIPFVEQIGPIPGEPYPQCWSPTGNTCQPCNGTRESLEALCNQTYPKCLDGCFVT